MSSIPPEVRESLCTAINTQHQISFTYQGKPRIVEPHDYGMQNERARLLAYQIGGRSGSGRLPDWRWFDVDKISDFEVLDQTFPGNRPAPSGRHHHWDKLFARVGEPK
jgi:predicted DNA-binding transcriptional regulator YafY